MKIFSIINYAFNYVIQTSLKYNIDESHALRHSMDVYHFANKIYDNEIYISPFLKEQKNVIMCSAILHDMCDKKYMNEEDGIIKMNAHMKDHVSDEELNMMNKIITTMSYSTVKKNGYPQLNNYNLAYHIVREADLLAGYDVERCIIYQMMHENYDYVSSVAFAKELFEKRMLKYIDDGLFVNEFSKEMAKKLHEKAVLKLNELIYL
jgi:HD superfamily phosphodiesterase